MVETNAPVTHDATGWKPQRWMLEDLLARKRDDTHEEAMATILAAADVVTLSYEEVALGYARARGFIRDDAQSMCAPIRNEGTVTMDITEGEGGAE